MYNIGIDLGTSAVQHGILELTRISTKARYAASAAADKAKK